jgi:hypothetical protein
MLRGVEGLSMGTPPATVNAERNVDGLMSRLACTRAAESGSESRFVFGYLRPAKERDEERALKT